MVMVHGDFPILGANRITMVTRAQLTTSLLGDSGYPEKRELNNDSKETLKIEKSRSFLRSIFRLLRVLERESEVVREERD